VSEKADFAWKNFCAHDSMGSHLMNHPIDYIVVVSADDDYLNGYHLFAEKVNRKSRAGYQLHGQPFNIDRVVCQAMIKPLEANADSFSHASANTTSFYKRPTAHA
jgi:hypothetical protein